ncbi:hypothetical protein D9M71_608090 [compost metagenome]
MGMSTGPIGITEIDGGIERGVGKQERPGAVGQVDRDFRMTLLKVLEPGQQPLGAKGRNHGELNDVGTLLAHHRQGIAFHRIQLRGYPAAVGEPGFGELYPATRTAKQFDIEKFLQPGNLPTYGTLSEGQLVRGLGEALMAGGCFEADQGRSAGDLPSHVRQSH